MDQETVEGFVVDIACLRKYSRDELLDKARVHGKDCSLMGHCVESGYGLVSADGASLLDPTATAQALDAIRRSDKEQGIRLRARRARLDGEMRTTSVEEIP